MPRHLRDVVVTEYGIADLRGRTDGECVAALLNVADSRFQPALLAQAQAARKLPAGYAIPEAFCRNTPQQLERALASHRQAGLFSEYPFGTDLTEDEITLSHALRHLREATGTRWARLGPSPPPASLASRTGTCRRCVAWASNCRSTGAAACCAAWSCGPSNIRGPAGLEVPQSGVGRPAGLCNNPPSSKEAAVTVILLIAGLRC